MYKLSEAAAEDIEDILTHSMLDFGLERTEAYAQSVSACSSAKKYGLGAL